MLCDQGAKDACRPYKWTFVGGDDESIAALTAVVEGCLHADPFERFTISDVQDALTALYGHGTQLLPAREPVPPRRVAQNSEYDVLAIIDAMESRGMHPDVIASTCDAIGTAVTAPLDTLIAHAVPVFDVRAVRETVEVAKPAPDSTISVGLGLSWGCVGKANTAVTCEG